MMDDGGGAGGTGDGGERRVSGPSVPGYVINALLGRGAFGVVYRAWQPAFARQVAIKVLLDTLDDRDSARLLRECRALGAASTHPNIVTVHDAGFTDDGRGFLVMEYLSGGSLADRVERDGTLPWRDVTRIGVGLAGALETAHRAGVLHRDIKPDNVLLSDYGEPKLADFGIARLAAGTATRTGPVYASILYAAPEVLAAGSQSSAASDVYALGGTLLTLLTGRPPFVPKADEPVGAFIGRIVSTPPDLRVPDVPVSLMAVLGRALAKDPSARQATAEELGEALREVEQEAEIPVTPMAIGTPRPSDGRPAVVTPPPKPAPASRRRRPSRSELVRFAVLGVFVSVVALVAVLNGSGTGDRRDQPSSVAGGPGTTTTIFRPAATTTPPSVVAETARSVAPVPPAARCAASITYGQTVACTIGAPGAVQRHDFTGSAGDHVYVRAVRLSGDFSLVPSSTVLGPTGAPDCPDRPDCPLKTSGRHTIVMQDTLGKATGDYTLDLQRTDDPAGCGTIAIGEAAEGTLQPAGSMACATFTAKGGERVRVNVVATGGGGLVFPEVNVLRVDQGTSACQLQENCPLDQPGRYIVLAAGAAVDNPTGPFRITVTCLAGPCRSG